MSLIEGRSMLDALRDFVERVESLGVEYMVTGSFAMSAYGEIRFTRDIDVVIEIDESDAAKFADTFEGDYYVDLLSIQRAIHRESMFNLVSDLYGLKIDCIVRKNTEFQKLAFQNRRLAKVADFTFWTITKEDLILSKLSWARTSLSEIQVKDIANLTASEYDFDYVDKWIERLELSEVWAEVVRWKTLHLK